MSEWNLSLFSSPDHEDLVAEIYHGEQFIGLVDQENGPEHLMMEFDPVGFQKLSRLALSDFEDILSKVRQRLDELKKTS